jgi:hypothetical protein
MSTKVRQFYFTIVQVKFYVLWAVVVTQLVERLIQTPEIHSSSSKTGKILSTKCSCNLKRQKIKEKGKANLKISMYKKTACRHQIK